MRKSCGLIGTLVIALLSLSPALKAGGEDEEVGFRFQYAAKFTCGFVPLTAVDRVIQGQYATAVAIHNPQTKDVTLRKKIALVFPPGAQKPGQVSPFITEKLGPDQALEVACKEIPSEFFPGVTFPSTFVQGFLVIETTRSVDVTATYSAGPATTPPGPGPSAPVATTTLTVATVDVERIKERKISREEDDDKDKDDKDKDKEGHKEDKR
jgi:hypothetical protein